MPFPTVHINGTHSETLIESYSRARGKVQDAIDALPTPNERDYYPQGVHAYREARAEHDEMGARLRDVRDELRRIIDHIDNQVGA